MTERSKQDVSRWPSISEANPIKVKGVDALGLRGRAAANAIYNATGVRDCPITLEKHLARLPTPA